MEMETKVRLGEMDSKASEALMDELRDRRIDAILSAKTSEETFTSCDDNSAMETNGISGGKGVSCRGGCTGGGRGDGKEPLRVCGSRLTVGYRMPCSTSVMQIPSGVCMRSWHQCAKQPSNIRHDLEPDTSPSYGRPSHSGSPNTPYAYDNRVSMLRMWQTLLRANSKLSTGTNLLALVPNCYRA